MKEERGPWYLLTGLVIGILVGLFYAWVAQPVEYVDTTPSSLRTDFKDQYRALIASAYLANQDLVRAQARLELLEDEDPLRAIAEQAQRKLAQDGSSQEARALGVLAIALGRGGAPPIQPVQVITTTATLPATPTETATFSPTPSATASPSPSATSTTTPTETQNPESPGGETATPETSPTPDENATPTNTPIPRPTNTPTFTPTPTLTPGAPFVLVDSSKDCDQELPEPMIQVIAEAASGEALPGVLVIVTWKDGEERFYTGLKPDKGAGYADFIPIPGVIYTLRLGEAGEPAGSLTAVRCTAPGGEIYWGAWVLRFVQP